jgi:hypothetical protein
MKEERRLVWRVLRRWKETEDSGRFLGRDEVDPWLQGEDGANLLLIAVQSPIELSHFVAVGQSNAPAARARLERDQPARGFGEEGEPAAE